MTWMYGDDYDYAATRLDGTVVRVGSIPVRVDSIGGDGRALVTTLATGKQSLVDVRELNLRPVPLGYVNHGMVAAYLCRMPMRNDWRQGLRPESMYVLNNFMDKRHLSDRALHDTIVGEYPPLAACLELVSNGAATSLAWHRHWAVASKARRISIHYKGEVVGGINNGNVVLNKSNKHLMECLNEACKALDESPQQGSDEG